MGGFGKLHLLCLTLNYRALEQEAWVQGFANRNQPKLPRLGQRSTKTNVWKFVWFFTAEQQSSWILKNPP